MVDYLALFGVLCLVALPVFAISFAFFYATDA